jgi:transcriptional regulator with XRE-family HTH domain
MWIQGKKGGEMKYPVSAQRLKEAMESKGMKAVDLSAKSGVLRSSLSQYINGSHNMSNKAAGAIGKVLDVNPLWLMGFDVPQKPKKPDILIVYDNLNEQYQAELLKRAKELEMLQRMNEYMNKMKGDSENVGTE